MVEEDGPVIDDSIVANDDAAELAAVEKIADAQAAAETSDQVEAEEPEIIVPDVPVAPPESVVPSAPVLPPASVVSPVTPPVTPVPAPVTPPPAPAPTPLPTPHKSVVADPTPASVPTVVPTTPDPVAPVVVKPTTTVVPPAPTPVLMPKSPETKPVIAAVSNEKAMKLLGKDIATLLENNGVKLSKTVNINLVSFEDRDGNQHLVIGGTTRVVHKTLSIASFRDAIAKFYALPGVSGDVKKVKNYGDMVSLNGWDAAHKPLPGGIEIDVGALDADAKARWVDGDDSIVYIQVAENNSTKAEGSIKTVSPAPVAPEVSTVASEKLYSLPKTKNDPEFKLKPKALLFDGIFVRATKDWNDFFIAICEKLNAMDSALFETLPAAPKMGIIFTVKFDAKKAKADFRLTKFGNKCDVSVSKYANATYLVDGSAGRKMLEMFGVAPSRITFTT